MLRIATACSGTSLALSLLTGSLAAQCATPWVPGVGSPGTDGPIHALCSWDPDGAGPMLPLVVVGGSFTTAGGVAVDNIAACEPSTGTWSSLGTGVTGVAGGSVLALTIAANGDLIAGGSFTMAGGQFANNIARWDGTAWSPLGSGTSGPVKALATLRSGVVVAGGQFSAAGGTTALLVAQWDGIAWSALGSGLGIGSPYAFFLGGLTALPDGDLVATGGFTYADGQTAHGLARWNGSTWSTLGTGLGPFSTSFGQAVVGLPNGDIVVAASSALLNRWNGSTWSSLGFGGLGYTEARALLALPNGDLLVGGEFTAVGASFTSPGTSANNIVRWNATSGWSALANGVDGAVYALAQMADGEVFVGGAFGTADGVPAANIAQLTTTCPASATSYGAGCPSSGGSNTLTATTMPWVDATFRATGTGLPSLAVVLAVTSVASIPPGAAPLAAALPQGVPGCDLLVNPDILGGLVTTTGTVESQLFLPNTPPLVGVTFFHQLLPFEVDPLANIVAITATNALQLTAGTF